MKPFLARVLRFSFACSLYIDEWILFVVQKYVADPLQFRGITLLTQFRIFGWITIASNVESMLSIARNGSMLAALVMWLGTSALIFMVLSPSDAQRERLDPGQFDAANVSRYLLDRILGRLMITFNTLMSFGILLGGGQIMPFRSMFPVLVAFYIEACQPKPPKPRKLRVRELAPA